MAVIDVNKSSFFILVELLFSLLLDGFRLL